MAETEKHEKSYLKEVLSFYFAPELRSAGTILYLGIFGYFTLYYVDNVFLAARFLLYILFGETALSGVAYLFTGTAFVLSLVLPFLISLYSIFILHKIWHKPEWKTRTRWFMTLVIAFGSIILIVLADKISHSAARQSVMRNFIEDAGLVERL